MMRFSDAHSRCGSPVDMRGSALPGLLASGWKRVRVSLVATLRSWIDQGLGEVRLPANSGASVKGKRSQASCLPSREKMGAESLPVEGAGKVRVLVIEVVEGEEAVGAAVRDVGKDFAVGGEGETGGGAAVEEESGERSRFAMSGVGQSPSAASCCGAASLRRQVGSR